jgi:hypothetical protein
VLCTQKHERHRLLAKEEPMEPPPAVPALLQAPVEGKDAAQLLTTRSFGSMDDDAIFEDVRVFGVTSLCCCSSHKVDLDLLEEDMESPEPDAPVAGHTEAGEQGLDGHEVQEPPPGHFASPQRARAHEALRTQAMSSFEEHDEVGS